jgi:CO/xanthine dehydrogenase Mo-binding subunit/aerobic-type carbon monoxide dehydrogenase small subunit (CoxS/CutS family)
MNGQKISFILNGAQVEVRLKPRETLLKYLRGEACLKGAKNGCSTGHCGACTVLIDGEAKKSCIVPLKQVAGKEVLTIEGLAPEGGLHPIQEAFLKTGAVQCGFCTPGMIMAAKALLDKNPAPGPQEIKTALKDNYCRCTGYVKIIEAVQLAARLLKGEKEIDSPEGAGLGFSLPDIDGVAKVKGTLPFADDREFPGLVYGKVLWARYPHGEIVSLDVSKAKEAPGVIDVLTADDVPGRNGFGALPTHPDQPILCKDKVRFLGDAVALVIAEREEQAAAALSLIEAEYRPLPGVFSPEDALKDNAPKLHPGGNVAKHLVHEVGRVSEVKDQAYLQIQGRFETPAVEHAYLEPEAGLGVIDDEGNFTLYAPTQFPFEVKRQLVEVLNLPEERIRVVVTPLGGGFGSKCDATVEFLLAVGAYKVRRPLKITLTREESLRVSTKRHPYVMDYEVGATKEGKLLYVDAKLLSDAGPYTNLSPRVIDQACIFSCGPYVVPNLRVEGWAVYTNNANCSAFRGFGINQAAVAIEAMIDELARKLAMDPFDMRYINALDVGDETISGEILKASVGIKETIRRCKEASYKSLEEVRKEAGNGRKIGLGVASGFKNVGAGKGKIDDAGAILELKENGIIRVRVSAVDMGQGIRTTMAQITAETLGVGLEQLEIISGDTFLTPKHGGAVGERQTLISGNAMLFAARRFLEDLRRKAALVYSCNPDQISLRGGDILAGNEAVDSLSGLAAKLKGRGEQVQAEYFYVAPRTFALADVEGRKSVPKEEYRNYPAYAYTTQAALVEVDEETGKVRLLKVIAAHDVGRIINPVKIAGQIEGSCSMGQGYALSEEYVVENGIHKTKTYGRLGVPSILDTPEYEIILVEDPEPNGPYGAKGISEVATVPITPAILNAIYDAVGVRVTSLPATPEKILSLMGK